MTGTAPYHQRVWWFPVDVPMALHSVSQPRAIWEDSVRTSVTRDGSLYFHASRVQLSDSSGIIRSAVKDRTRKAYLAVDGRTRYRDIDVVVDQVHLAGISDICFITAYRTPNLKSQ